MSGSGYWFVRFVPTTINLAPTPPPPFLIPSLTLRFHLPSLNCLPLPPPISPRRGIGKQTQLIGKPSSPVSVALAKISAEHQYNGPSPEISDDQTCSSSETPPPASPRTSQSDMEEESGFVRSGSPPNSLAITATNTTNNTTNNCTTTNPPNRSHSLYELEGVLDLIILSFLTSLPPHTLLDVADTSHKCTHCRCPANCAECTALSRKNWGVREKKLSIDAKISR